MKDVIQAFVDGRELAVVGVSRSPQKWGSEMMKELEKAGYTVHPVHPEAEEIRGRKAVASVKDLPASVENIILSVKPEVTEKVVRDIPGTGIKRVWMHQGAGRGSYSESAHEWCRENGIEVVHGFCPFMFFPPGGFHKIHFFFKKLFGGLPREYRESLKAG